MSFSGIIVLIVVTCSVVTAYCNLYLMQIVIIREDIHLKAAKDGSKLLFSP